MTLAQGRAPKEPAEGKASRLDDAVGPQTEAVVDLDAIAHNVRVLREFAGDAALMAVIKADGYNHGAVAVARTALSAGAGNSASPPSRRHWSFARQASPLPSLPGCTASTPISPRRSDRTSRSACPPRDTWPLSSTRHGFWDNRRR